MRATLLLLFSHSSFHFPEWSIHSTGWPEGLLRRQNPGQDGGGMGALLRRKESRKELEALKEAGIGGVEITPIYGVQGLRRTVREFPLAAMDVVVGSVLKEATRLGLGVDMAAGTGWPFGGPWVNDEDAAKNFQYKIYDLSSGQQLKEKITFVQQPYLRAIGSLIYETNKEGEAKLKQSFRRISIEKD